MSIVRESALCCVTLRWKEEGSQQKKPPLLRLRPVIRTDCTRLDGTTPSCLSLFLPNVQCQFMRTAVPTSSFLLFYPPLFFIFYSSPFQFPFASLFREHRRTRFAGSSCFCLRCHETVFGSFLVFLLFLTNTASSSRNLLFPLCLYSFLFFFFVNSILTIWLIILLSFQHKCAGTNIFMNIVLSVFLYFIN